MFSETFLKEYKPTKIPNGYNFEDLFWITKDVDRYIVHLPEDLSVGMIGFEIAFLSSDGITISSEYNSKGYDFGREEDDYLRLILRMAWEDLFLYRE